jgi:hypothetical protein
MKLETICWVFAVIGLICTGIGRRLLIMEASSISDGWKWAVKLLPLADIMFLARFWDSAKTGAFVSLAGLVCLLPLGGLKMWEKKHPKEKPGAGMTKLLDADSKNGVFVSIKAEHDTKIAAKQRKLAQLNAHMGAWYTNMTERRSALTNATPEQLAAFNEEAIAYKALHQVTKDEAAELQTLLNRKMDSWGDLSDEDYAAYFDGQDKKAKRQHVALAPTGGQPLGEEDDEN